MKQTCIYGRKWWKKQQR